MCLLYKNVCLILLQSKTVTNTVQNNLKSRYFMLRKNDESVIWQTQAQQATTDRHNDLNGTFLRNTNTMKCPVVHL